MSDPLSKLHHDHVHLTRLVDGLRENTQACLRDDADPLDLRADFDEFLRIANDELFEHFDREETGLFPFLVEHFPDLRDAIGSLEAGHDRMCGQLTRMERLVALDDQAFAREVDSLVALFARFDATHAKHARIESDILSAVEARLDPQQRRALAEILADL